MKDEGGGGTEGAKRRQQRLITCVEWSEWKEREGGEGAVRGFAGRQPKRTFVHEGSGGGRRGRGLAALPLSRCGVIEKADSAAAAAASWVTVSGSHSALVIFQMSRTAPPREVSCGGGGRLDSPLRLFQLLCNP